MDGGHTRAGTRKKLKGAAAHWARCAKQPKRNAEAEDDERRRGNIDKAAWDAAFAWDTEDGGAPAVDEYLLPDGSFNVWPENERTVGLFWTVRRLWRVAPMGGVMSLDWAQVEARLRRTGLDSDALDHEFDRLQVMEDAALEELHRG